MPATIRPVGVLKNYVDEQEQVMIACGMSVRQALVNLKIPPEIVALVLVNGKAEHKDYIVQDGDELKIIAVLGGG